ncbi:MAG: hypothetical protein ABGF52_12285 [Candidatus Asgardarchaeum sp.]
MVKKEDKENEELSCCQKIVAAILFIGFISVTIWMMVHGFAQAGQQDIDIRLSQDVANEICMQLTGEDYVIASDDYRSHGFGHGGSFICDISDESASNGVIINK